MTDLPADLSPWLTVTLMADCLGHALARAAGLE